MSLEISCIVLVLYSLSIKEMEKGGGSGGEIRIYAIPYLTAGVFLK